MRADIPLIEVCGQATGSLAILLILPAWPEDLTAFFVLTDLGF
jgi:hypothetical protein